MPSRQPKALPNPHANHTPRDATRRQYPDSLQRPLPTEIPLATRDSTDHLSSSAVPLTKNASKHSRSMSHPFPSLFGTPKKATRPQDFDFEDEEVQIIEHNGISNGASSADGLRRTPGYRRGASGMSTGKCMTCDSVVRWPSELNVFRCTICLAINDLVPARQSVSSSQSAARILKLSTEKAKSLIASCISTFLRTHYGIGQPIQETVLVSPPRSPCLPQETESEAGLTSSVSGSSPIYLSSTPVIKIQDDGVFKFPPPVQNTNANIYSSSSPSSTMSSFVQMNRSQSDNAVPLAPDRPPPVPPKDSAGNTAQNISLSSLPYRPGPSPRQAYTELKTGIKSIIPSSSADPTPSMFKALDDYLVSCFSSFESINRSFSTGPILDLKSNPTNRSRPIESIGTNGKVGHNEPPFLANIDEKTLLLGDFAENGSWWTGKRQEQRGRSRPRGISPEKAERPTQTVHLKSPQVDWTRLAEFYELILWPDREWKRIFDEAVSLNGNPSSADSSYGRTVEEMNQIEEQIHFAALRTQRLLMSTIESLLKRPSRPIRDPSDLRFILIILANPLLVRPQVNIATLPSQKAGQDPSQQDSPVLSSSPDLQKRPQHGPGQHSGIIKRLLGILAGLSNDCHKHLVSWFSRFPPSQFNQIVDIVGGFVTYRLTRQHGRKISNSQHNPTDGLVPNLDGPGAGTSAHLHAALEHSVPSKKPKKVNQPLAYEGEWQIKAAAKVMSLLFAANYAVTSKKPEFMASAFQHARLPIDRPNSQYKSSRHGQILPASSFYNTLLDYSDLLADFESWENRKARFAFCQYPFFLSIWAKIRILDFDARRQMEVKAREAFFSSLNSRIAVSQYLVLRVRRNCLAEDSMRGISEVVGAGQEEIKKSLRIEFAGEEGIDGGGLKKEWFLLLTRDIFDPHHGLFIYDEESRHCYFNPFCFETSDQFFLVGALMGLAIYNSTILDVALPPFAFRKLLSSAPSKGSQAVNSPKQQARWTLDDLAELRPSLASGLRQLLEFDGNVEEVFCRDFVAELDKYGQAVQVPLCQNGEKKAVTNANRREFVDLYVHYMIDTAVARQYEPFKRGFFTVCGGNALSLFRSEEIELLVCGSDEPLDVPSLKAVAQYDNWGEGRKSESEAAIRWFWSIFESWSPKRQRKLLSFVTGSDRIPAMGAANLIIKISCLGEDCERFPTARTCFNVLQLYRYSSRAKLEQKLWTAIVESEGFGLK